MCVLLLLRAIRTSPRPRLRWLTRSPYPRCRSCRRPTTSTSTSTSPASEPPPSKRTTPQFPTKFSLNSHLIPSQSLTDSRLFFVGSLLIPSQFSTSSQMIPKQSLTWLPTDSHQFPDVPSSWPISSQFPTDFHLISNQILARSQLITRQFPNKS